MAGILERIKSGLAPAGQYWKSVVVPSLRSAASDTADFERTVLTAAPQTAYNSVRPLVTLAYSAAQAARPDVTLPQAVQRSNRLLPRAKYADARIGNTLERLGTDRKYVSTVTGTAEALAPGFGIGKVKYLEDVANPAYKKLIGYTALRAGEGYLGGFSNELANSGDIMAARRAGFAGSVAGGALNLLASPLLGRQAWREFVNDADTGRAGFSRIRGTLRAGIPKDVQIPIPAQSQGRAKNGRFQEVPRFREAGPEDFRTISFPAGDPEAERILRKGKVDKAYGHEYGSLMGDQTTITVGPNGKVVDWNTDDPAFERSMLQRAGIFAPENKPGFIRIPGGVPEGSGRTKGSTGKKLEEVLRDNNPEFNVNRLNVTPEQKQVLSEEVDRLIPKVKQLTGDTLKNREVVELANVSSKIQQKVFSREETAAQIASNLNLRERIAQAAQEGRTDSQFVRDFLSAKTYATDAARKLQALSVNADPSEKRLIDVILEGIYKVEQDADKVAEAARKYNLDDPTDQARFYREFVKPKASDWIDTLRYNSMLSSPNTHINNAAVGALTSGVLKPIEKSIAGGIDFFQSGITGSPRKRFASEGPAYVGGAIASVPDSLKRASEAFAGKLSDNLDTRDIPLAPGGGFAGGTENVLKVTARALEAVDQFFTGVVEGGEKAALKLRQSRGVDVPALQAQAEDAAKYTLFRQGLFKEGQGTVLDAFDQMTSSVEKLRNNPNPIVRTAARWSVPFLRTPMNIAKQGVEYNPVLGLSTLGGNADKQLQLAKAAMGAATFTGAAMLIGANRMTWAEPTDPDEKAAYRAAGMQPYSVKLGDTWVGYNKLPPVLAFNFAMAAAIDDLEKSSKEGASTADLVLGSIAKYGEFMADQTYFKSLGDVMQLAKGDVEAASRVIGNYPQQLVPFRAFGGWLARLTDATQRKVDDKAGFVDQQVQQLMLNIPGLSQKVPARTGPDGEPIATGTGQRLANAFLPVRTSKEDAEGAFGYQVLQDTKRVRKETKARSDAFRAAIATGNLDQIRSASQGMTPEQVRSVLADLRQKEAQRGFSAQELALASLSEAQQVELARQRPDLLPVIQRVRQLESALSESKAKRTSLRSRRRSRLSSRRSTSNRA